MKRIGMIFCLSGLVLNPLLAAPEPPAPSSATPNASGMSALQGFDVKTFGAIGDGKAVDSPALNRAIEAAAKQGGGTVYFPPGRYLSASIRLKSNITLYLEAGATIEAASDTVATYDEPEPNESKYQDFGHSHWQNSLIWGIGLENVSILGPGLIHGKGLSSGHQNGVYKDAGKGSGNKAIALKNCRNVVLRDFAVLHGGHFAILATGVDNLTLDNVKMDTNRDGVDIDCCRNVRVSNCSVNTPWDDGICLKASYALGELRPCENVTITNCFLAGNFDEGTLIDATFKRSTPEYKSYRTGRIKLGTESNGDFKNITITNCVFDDSRGIAIESVDGSVIEDVAISNITMRHVANSPIFIRLGNRARGPNHPPVGAIRRVSISNIVASDADWTLGCIITGIPGHAVEDIRLSDLNFVQQGGGQPEHADIEPPEKEESYPEPGMFGRMPSYGVFLRHVKGVEMHHVKLSYIKADSRPAYVLTDVSDAHFDHIEVKRAEGSPAFDLRSVTDFSVTNSRGVPDTKREGQVAKEKL